VPDTITDYHKLVRDAQADAIRAALDGAGYALPVKALDDPETDLGVNTDMPCVAVACVGPEQDRDEMATNQRDGIGFSCSITVHSNSVTSGAQAPNVPEPTVFRRLVRTTFHNKRLSGVEEVGWCEVSELGEIYDKNSVAFQSLKAGFAVTAVGRFPRTDS
jgi:hypothetical protein